MTTPNSFDDSLDDTLGDWLVHDESCPTSWSGVGPEKCDCIAKDQKRNLKQAISKLYLTHRNAEYKKLLEQAVEVASVMYNSPNEGKVVVGITNSAVPASAIKELIEQPEERG